MKATTSHKLGQNETGKTHKKKNKKGKKNTKYQIEELMTHGTSAGGAGRWGEGQAAGQV